jgi:GT2 family glycosyltransferase
VEVSTSQPQLSFIILTWNSEKFLQACFTSIIKKCHEEHVSFEVIVIDNGSSDNSTQLVKQFGNDYPGNFILLDLDHNTGTTYPRNLGMKQAKGDILCILDSDTELGEGSLTEIFYHLQADQHCGLICPRLQLPDGSTQNSVKKFPTMLDKLIKIPRILFGIQTGNHDFYADFPFQVTRPIDSAISACWFFRRGLIESVGYLDEKIFYSPEDLDYSLRVWKAGFKNLYYPEFTVLHHTQQITHRKPFSKTSRSHFWGLVYYYHKHGGWVVRPQFAESANNHA